MSIIEKYIRCWPVLISQTDRARIAIPNERQAVKHGFVVWYRSIFDWVRDFLHDEVLAGQDKDLNKYLKADLLIIADMVMKQLAQALGRVRVRDHHAALRGPLNDDGVDSIHP